MLFFILSPNLKNNLTFDLNVPKSHRRTGILLICVLSMAQFMLFFAEILKPVEC